MNILFITTHLNPGGITSYVFSLAKELKKNDHNIFIASSGGSLVESLENTGINHIAIPIRTKSELSPKVIISAVKLRNFVKNNNIQIVHAQTRVTQVVAFWLSKLTGVVFVGTCHGFFKPRFSRKKFQCWGKKVIAISQAVKENLINFFEVNPKKIEFIYNGIDVDSFEAASLYQVEDFIQRFNLDKAIPIVGIIARLSSVKGHKYLIEAAKEVVESGKDIQILIVGDGNLKDELIEQTINLKIDNLVFFVPSVKNLSIPLAVMDIFVMPSLQEGLGLSIMEAQARGVPVVASNVGGIPELVQNEETGLLVPSADVVALAKSIKYLLENESGALSMAEKAKNNIQSKFSIRLMADKTETFYRMALEGIS